MNKKICNIAVCLLLGMAVFSSVARANSLNKLDIRRSNLSSSALNVTLYTASPYDDNIAVTKKSDNKYVILLPNVTSSAGSSSVDFSSMKDVVSDVDIKSVSDGSGGYTKVTLTTTKPVSINTSARKSAPLTEEQKAYKNLIAQHKGYVASNNSAQSQVKVNNVYVPTNTVIKAQDNKDNLVAVKSKNVVDKVVEDNKNKTTSKNISEVPKTSINFEVSKAKINDKNLISETPIVLDNKKSDVQKEIKAETDKNSKYVDKNLSNEETLVTTSEKKKTNITTEPFIDVMSGNKTSSKVNHRRIFENIFTTFILLIASLAGLLFFFKNIKKSLEKSAVLKKTFKENLHEKPLVVADYSDIANDNTLNWQEKYQKFISCVEEDNIDERNVRYIGDGEYEFVASAEDVSIEENHKIEKGYSEILNSYDDSVGSAQLKPNHDYKFTSYNKPTANSSPDRIQSIKKVKNRNFFVSKDLSLGIDANEHIANIKTNLEKTYGQSPSIERLKPVEDMTSAPLSDNFKLSGDGKMLVINDDDVIANNIRKSPKLRAFANKIALEETKRDMPLPKQRSEIIRNRNIESKNINMDNIELYNPRRSFEGANLSSADLISSSSLNGPSERNTISNPISSDKGFTTISVDEFFDTIESGNRATASASLSSKVADRLRKISVEFVKPSERGSRISQRNILTGKIVKSSYNIDDNSGFYIVENEEGTNSLIGRVGSNITVLKKYNDKSNTRLQVRKDSDNVYIVRAGGERYLVEVNRDKMGVLLEL